MADQGAGGHISQHSRSESQNDTAPAERLADQISTTSTDPEDHVLQHPRSESETSQTSNTSASSAPSVVSCPSLIQPENMQARPLAPARTPEPRSHISHPPRPLEPPVTKATLSELDVSKIIHNPKLRHDINFDPELHFRPNLDGDKGRRKQEKANQFWTTLRDQLTSFVVDRDAFRREFPTGADWCLPILLKSVKEIIQTLVPQRDREFLHEGFNVELLMQQFNQGMADLEKVASWLSGVLKLHCAPMRDAWVDDMYSELSNGNRNNDMAELVKGMRSLLSVLEAMKLDVANHQIRCLRPMLIEDTVHFEQRFFYKKIAANRLDISGARLWYAEALRCHSGTPHDTRSFGETAAFFAALAKLILPSTAKETIPNTFLFDEERIIKLRSDMLDAVNLEVCMRLYDDLDRVSRITSVTPSFVQATTSVPSYVADEEASVHSNRNSCDFNFFNMPPSRPSSLTLSACGSTTSSPRSSGYITLQPPTSADTAESKSDKDNTVYDSLVALLNTAPQNQRPQQRWQGLVPPIAIQILRYTNAPQDFLPRFEAKLAQHLCETNSDLYQAVEVAFQRRIMRSLSARVKDFRSLSGVALFSVATGGRMGGSGSARGDDGGCDHPVSSEAGQTSREEGALQELVEDMAVRLAHLGILHWRVWAQLAYLEEDPDEMDIE